MGSRRYKIAYGDVPLVREVLSSHLPELARRLDIGLDLCEAEARRVGDAFMVEFARSGLGGDGEPTMRGVNLERLHDHFCPMDEEAD